MLMSHYVLKKTLNKHYDSINTLAFSHDGSLFTSGADDGLVPVTTLLWHSQFGYTVVAGDASGDVHTLCLQKSADRNSAYHSLNSVPGPIHCMAQSGICLAIGCSNVIQLIKQVTIATWERAALLPDLPKFPELDGELPEPMAWALHFLGANDDILLVMYLDHGTFEIKWRIHLRSCKMYNAPLLPLAHAPEIDGHRGCSAVSPDKKMLAIMNLYDGIDWNSLTSNHFVDAPFQHTTTHPMLENVILPLTFIHAGKDILSGTSYGCTRITTEDIVQAMAYSSAWSTHQIVTSVAERGSETVIWYWIQDRKVKKHAEPGQEATKKSVQGPTIVKRASVMAIMLLGLAIFVTFWNRNAWSIYLPGGMQGYGHMKLSVLTLFGLQPEGSLQRTLGKSNDDRNFSDDDLHQILNAQLDMLAISPQAKQGILPALFGITKLTDAQLRDMLMSQLQTELDPASLSRCSTSVSVNTQPVASSPPYQARQHSFTSNSGSGYTTWYFAKSDTNIMLPPTVPQAKTGHLYVHLNTSTNSHQYWMVGINNQWDIVLKGSEYPLNHDRVLSIHSNGNPSWITRASTTTMQSRKEREMREKLVPLHAC
ncbi:hypothetical protein F5148DRAFT_1283680 [Russula earlei]|uniref:Uncharacterized protein n=1 Tax=Russula earlei TaxID=71964 RepID=A0ACC0UAL6_9AGAM|nr:hypothetical protein F5148DRAFT_1283680 [Russula earlei]